MEINALCSGPRPRGFQAQPMQGRVSRSECHWLNFAEKPVNSRLEQCDNSALQVELMMMVLWTSELAGGVQRQWPTAQKLEDYPSH
jgi:hypothetical protein